SEHWYLRKFRFRVRYVNARDCAAATGGSPLANSCVITDGLECEGSQIDTRSTEVRARGGRRVANGLTRQVRVGEETYVLRKLNLMNLSRGKPQGFRWARLRTSAGFMM